MVTEQQHYYYGLGRRKSSIARVRLYPGAGAVIVNGRPVEDVIPRASLRQEMLRPLAVTGALGRYNLQVKASGGGVSGWAASAWI